MRNAHEKLRVDRVSMKTAFLLVLLCTLTLLMTTGAPDMLVVTADAKDNCADYSRKLYANSSTTIWVPGNYSSIQEAINEARPGDTVYVEAGVYHEDIVINKSLFLVGENATTTVLDGEGESLLILSVVASDVTVRNFTVKNTRADQPAYGVSIKDSQNVSLVNVTVGQSYTGLVLDSSSNCEIVNNAFIDNYAYGIDLPYKSVNNTIVGNWIVSNPTGILIWDETCENNRFHHNNFVNNTNQIDVTYAGLTMWDDGNEGNYWSDYTGEDDGSEGRVAEDGVGDTLLPHQDVDYYPLVARVSLSPVPPIARFSIPSDPLFVNVYITFDPSDSYDPDGDILGYFWDFGDGANKTRVNKGDNNTVEHSYANTDSYTVSLTVTDNDGLKNSFTETLIVQKMNSSIAVRVTPSTVTVGNNVTISGDIAPKRVGVNVTISYMFYFPSEPWKELVTVETEEPLGSYTYVWTPPQAGYVLINASWLGDDKTMGAEAYAQPSSGWYSVTIEKALSVITVNVEPQNVTVGSNVTISGTINPRRADANVSVQIYSAGESNLICNTTVITDVDGSYTYVWKTSEIGTYEIRVSWEGDQNTYSAESETKTVKVEAASPPSHDVLLYIIVAIAIIAILTCFVYFMKRKSRTPHHRSLRKFTV